MGKFKRFNFGVSSLFAIASFVAILYIGGRWFHEDNATQPTTLDLTNEIIDEANKDNCTITDWPHNLSLLNLNRIDFFCNGTDDGTATNHAAQFRAFLSDLEDSGHGGTRALVGIAMGFSFLLGPALGAGLFGVIYLAKIILEVLAAAIEPCLPAIARGASAACDAIAAIVTGTRDCITSTASASGDAAQRAGRALYESVANVTLSRCTQAFHRATSHTGYSEQDSSSPSSQVEDPSRSPSLNQRTSSESDV